MDVMKERARHAVPLRFFFKRRQELRAGYDFSYGNLTGYAYGLDAKRWLLRHEGALLL